MDNEILKDRLKKVFTSTAVDKKEDLNTEIKIEEVDVFFSSNRVHNQSSNYRGQVDEISVEVRRIFIIVGTKISQKTNPVKSKGETSKCNICGSKFHGEKNCPDAIDRNKHEI